jgi:hypothetical protein
MLDVEAAAEASCYAYSFDTAQTGAVNAAHASLARIDTLCVQLFDPAESDGSTVPSVAIVYTAGSAGSGVAPADPPQSIRMYQINVPAAGTAPTVSFVGPRLAAAGGRVLVRNQAERDSLVTSGYAYDGLAVYRQDTNCEESWNGATWDLFSPTTRHFDRLIQNVANADFGAGTFTTLATCPGIPVPAWAQDGTHTAVITATLCGTIVTSSATYLGRVVLGAGPTVPPEAPQSFSGAASDSIPGIFSGTFTIPASTTSLTPAAQMLRAVGTGAYRLNSGSNTGTVIWEVLIK